MNRPDGTDKTFEVLRELPAEVTIEQVGRMVATFPLLGASGSWFSRINLNSILMTSAGAIIIAASVYLYTPQEPNTQAVRTQQPAPVPEAIVAPPVVENAPAVAVVPKKKATAITPPAPTTVPMVAVKSAVAPSPQVAAAPASLGAVRAPFQNHGAVLAFAPEDEEDGPRPIMKDRQFDLRGFTGVAVHGSMDVAIEPGDFSVTAEGDPELVDLLEVTVADKLLSISTRKNTEHKSRNSCDRSVHVMVKMPTLDRMDLVGSGDITAEAFKGSNKLDLNLRGSGDIRITAFQGLSTLSIQLDGSGDVVGDGVEVSGTTRIALAGSGDVRLEGRTDAIEVKVVGSGDVSVTSFVARTCDVQVVGSGDAHVNCSGTLNRRVIGSGDIHNAGDAGGEGSNSGERNSY